MPESITDRPWGATLHALALRRFSGELAIDSDHKRFAITFDDGAIAGARSPLAADAIARIALTSHAINQSHVAEIARQVAQAPQRDEVEIVAEVGKLSLDAAAKLRHRAIAQRAARTFALERGEMQPQAIAPARSGTWVDHRHVVFLGARTHLSDARLLDVVRQAGASLSLNLNAREALAQFGFDATAQPVLDVLARGTSLPELEAAHRELDPRLIHAIIYALVACEAFAVPSRITATRAARPTPPARTTDSALIPPEARRPSSDIPVRSMTPIVHVELARTASRSEPAPEPPRTARPEARLTARSAGAPYASTVPPQDAGTNTPAATRPRTDQGRSATGSAPPLAAAASRAQATATPPSGLPVVRIHGTATPPLGVPATPPLPAPPAVAPAGTKAQPPLLAEPATSRVDTDEVRFPDQRTPSPAFPDQRTPGPAFPDQRTPGLAFPEQRTPGFTEQRTPTSGPVTSRVSTDTAAAAEAACKRGETAMKRDQPGDAILEFKAAVDLDPANVDYSAMLAWAKFCAAGDKAAIGNDTRKVLERAVFKSHRPERARFYLGRVERMLGRDKEALRHFNEVLELKPNHAEAASEVRAIEARLAAARGSGGLFGRKK